MEHILSNIIIIIIIAAILIGVTVHICKTKKKSKGCVGCPYCNQCGGTCHSDENSTNQ